MDGRRSLLRSRPAIAALALALLVRVAQIAATHGWMPVADPADYVRHALSIAHGHGMAPSFIPHGGPSALRPPAYPYFLGAVFAVTGDSYTAARIASALLGVLTVALIGLIAEQLWDRRVAIVSLFVAAIFPPLVLLSGTLLSESLGLPLVLALVALLLAHRGRPQPRWLAPACGVLFGLALLDRPAFVMFALPLAAGLWGRPRRSLRALRGPVVGLLVALLVIVPWTIRNATEFHALVPISTQSGFLVGGTYNPTSANNKAEPASYLPVTFDPALRSLFNQRALDENQLSRKLQSAGRRYAAHHVPYVGKVLALNTLRMLGIYHAGTWTKYAYAFQGIGANYALVARAAWYLVALLALIGVARGAYRRVPWWLWLVAPLLLVGAVWISGDVRYRVAIEPFVIWPAAFALAALTGRRPARR